MEKLDPVNGLKKLLFPPFSRLNEVQTSFDIFLKSGWHWLWTGWEVMEHKLWPISMHCEKICFLWMAKLPQNSQFFRNTPLPFLQLSQYLGIFSPCNGGVTMNVTKLTAQLNISRAVGGQLCLDLLQQPRGLKQKSHSLGFEDNYIVLAF